MGGGGGNLHSTDQRKGGVTFTLLNKGWGRGRDLHSTEQGGGGGLALY